MLAYRSDIGIPGYTGNWGALLSGHGNATVLKRTPNRAQLPATLACATMTGDHTYQQARMAVIMLCTFTCRVLPRLEYCACPHQWQQQAHWQDA